MARGVLRVTPVVACALVLMLSGLVATGIISTQSRRASGVVPPVGRDIALTAMDMAVGPANNSPMLLVDPTESRFVVAAHRLDAPDFGCALQVSGDSGRSWVPAAPVVGLPAGADKCYAPEVAFDRNGVLYYLFVGLTGRGNEPMGVFLTTSTDRAQTFTAPRQVLGPLRFGVRMAIDRDVGTSGRLHLVWIEATSDPPLGGFGPPPNPILAAHSDDGGRTFSSPVQVSDPARARVVAPALALGANHSVHVAYYDLEDDAVDYQGLEGPVWDGTWSVAVSTSSDSGAHFERHGLIADAVGPPERIMLIFTMAPPSLVAHGDELCAAWTDARHGDPDVLLSCSSARGARWDPPRRLNDDGLDNGHRQYLPRLSVSSDGRVDAIFYDRRGDPENIRNDVSYTFSIDGGRTFAPTLPLTRDPSDARIGPQYANVSAQGQYELGSRLGLLSAPSRALAAWADTRNSRLGTTSQNLMSVEVAPPRADGPARARVVARLVLVALTVGFAVGVVVSRRRRPTPRRLRG